MALEGRGSAVCYTVLREAPHENPHAARFRFVFALLGSANRDERHFKDPDTLDLGCEPNKHLSFGMIRSDPHAIHELYLLDGTLVRRSVPPGVNFP